MPASASARRAGRGRLALTVATVAVVIVADQVTKHLAVEHLASGPVHLLGPLSLQLEYNTGVAFSIGAGSSWPVALALFGLVGLLAWLARGTRSVAAALALGLVLGGALGNLADRLVGAHKGAVVDFVHLTFWPTFNLADTSIVVGCALLLLSRWRHERAAGTQPPGLPSEPRAGDRGDPARADRRPGPGGRDRSVSEVAR